MSLRRIDWLRKSHIFQGMVGVSRLEAVETLKMWFNVTRRDLCGKRSSNASVSCTVTTLSIFHRLLFFFNLFFYPDFFPPSFFVLFPATEVGMRIRSCPLYVTQSMQGCSDGTRRVAIKLRFTETSQKLAVVVALLPKNHYSDVEITSFNELAIRVVPGRAFVIRTRPSRRHTSSVVRHFYFLRGFDDWW